MSNLIKFLVLPPQISAFEDKYLRRMNRVGFGFFALHVPMFMLIAFFNGTGVLMALGLTLAVMVGPAIAYFAFDNPRAVSMVYGFTSMLMGGLLVHFGQGPAQIEMHFYFFALLAMLAVYGNPLVIVTAAVTVALHHLLLWLILPHSVFNYAAPIWVVAIHAAFVVLESVATCYIARSFFDNVIGLEKIVQARTQELDGRNQDMRLVLDNVGQGFLTIGNDGVMSPEKSRIVETWLGASSPGQTFPEYIRRHAPHFATSFRLAWTEVIENVMPLELTIDQLPHNLTVDKQHLRVDYTPIMAGDAIAKTLVMISDVTADVERGRLEAEQRDIMSILERIGRDKAGVLEFFDEGGGQIDVICDAKVTDRRLLKRLTHTLKGNAMIFGVNTVGGLCHTLETRLDEEGDLPSATERAALKDQWARLCAGLATMLGEKGQRKLEIDDADHESVLGAVLRGDARDKVAQMIKDWKFERSERRLTRIADQARGIAKRLNKGELTVNVKHSDLRFDPVQWSPFWSAFVHVVRNAVDHGLEAPEDRARAGKRGEGQLTLLTAIEGNELVIRLSDDGRGIDWAAVAEKAKKHGLPHQNPADLFEALCADGVSTRDDVNEFSGRGVGLGVVRTACTDRGGRMVIASKPGRGTDVEFRFPASAASAEVRSAA